MTPTPEAQKTNNLYSVLRVKFVSQHNKNSLSTIDIKTLLGKLDSHCLGFLEKASQFCVRQQHAEVAIEHYLLQMLDGRSNPLNRLLESAGIDPVAWIRQLLIRNDEFEQGNSSRPVFSEGLLLWFEKAGLYASGHANRDIIQASDLVISLLQETQVNGPLGLSQLDKVSAEDVEAYFTETTAPVSDPGSDIDIPAIDIAVPEQVTEQQVTEQPVEQAVDEDCTVMMTQEEVESFAKKTSDMIDLAITGYGGLQKIGEGGMANVYRASHLGLDREVALKVLNPGSGADDDFVERFLREARIVAKFTHPNIIQIYDVNQVNGITYLAMEYVPGGELSDRIDAGYSLDQSISILSQVLSALQSAHDKGFIHRDIKPANILFRDDDSIVLTDFGIARAMGEDTGLTIAGSILGTPRYMSPEQAKGETLDHRSDLYSVGVLFYQMLEKKLPYIGESAIGTAMKHIIDPIPTLSSQWSKHQTFIERAMAKDASERFQTGKEMIAALQSLN